jgi:hypothetical protein
MFPMLDPDILEIAISPSIFRATTMEQSISGTLVPAAKKINPMSDILTFAAQPVNRVSWVRTHDMIKIQTIDLGQTLETFFSESVYPGLWKLL